MEQIQLAKFVSKNGKICVLCDGDTALGDLHDFLIALKGEIVDRMVTAQKQDVASQEAHSDTEPCEVNE
jgi:hypothetical protein